MAVMNSCTYYLPKEELKLKNYPEVEAISSNIQALISYVMEVQKAIDNYSNNIADKVIIDIVSLKRYINAAEEITNILGNANNVCFDILVEIRQLQSVLQNILYIYNRYGNQYIRISS
jgi:hypothetical protein